MERVLVIGASGGIGSAIAAEAARQGAEVTGLSRSGDGLDVTDEASVERVLGALEGPFDLIFVATGALVVNGHEPEKAFASVTYNGFADQFAVNAIGPALVLKHSLRLLPKEGWSVFAALSARVGSIGDNKIGGWHAYRAAKAALNQILHGAAIEMARTHKDAICLALHPGTVETAFTAKYAGRHKTVSAAEAAQNLLRVVNEALPERSGGFYDYAGEEIPW
ncbi:SDR family oxidoreductase [Aestuariibius sp. 2305UL40-4]|uniref:SDR family oxidoreductase n=1 Tax=Aestuariibius violaceus TaxID=3234132 RepID=UPI00345E6E48